MKSIMKHLLLVLYLIGIISVLIDCRGTTSESSPVHLNRNMDTQEKYKPQSESMFFEDGSTMRVPVEHTVARGQLHEDDAYFKGKIGETDYVSSPIAFSPEVLSRGKERYTIYCSPCHGDRGNGKGMIMKYKFPVQPTSYFEPRILQAKDGYIFEVISDGIRNMFGYKLQIPVRDRWCIVAHVRELQKAVLPESEKGILPQINTASK